MLSPTTIDDAGPTASVERPTPGDSQSQAQPQSSSEFGALTPATAITSSWSLDPTLHLVSDASTSPGESWPLDHFVTNPSYLAYQEELRCLIFNTAQTAATTREGTPDGDAENFQNGLVTVGTNTLSDDSAARRQTARLLAQGRRLEYLKNYIGEVAPWLDMFDSDRAFGMQLPVLAQTSPALLYAILALSARHTERKEGKKHSFDSLELYQEAIRLLTPLLQIQDQQIITICTLLCCLEMMSASAQDWRRHTEGCAALFDSFSVHGFSGGLLQAVFWCYARMDLCSALISDGTEGTLLETSKWLPPGASRHDARGLFRSSGSPDMHANYAVYLCSEVCELVADRTRFFELGVREGLDPEELSHRWVCLWEELQAWTRDRPPELLPTQTLPSTPFPQPLFLHWSAISSTQLYHTACVLLLGSMPKPLNLKLGVTGSAVWHAKNICGISLANPHRGCLNNAIQPLWIAGRLLSHKSEHALLVEMIRGIESMTGWGTCWRIDDLESAWGYKVRKDTRNRNVAI